MSESTDPRPIIALLCDITDKRLGPSRTVWDRSGLPGTFWDHLFYSENFIIRNETKSCFGYLFRSATSCMPNILITISNLVHTTR